MDKLDKILDECIDRLNRGESLAACLADYPEYLEQLAPLLAAMQTSQDAFPLASEADAKTRQRQRFQAALAARRTNPAGRKPLWRRLPVWAGALATVVVVAIIALLGFGIFPSSDTPLVGTTPAVTSSPAETPPGETPEVVVALPDAGGNFVFLISDEVNAIADFSELNVTITGVTLNLTGDSAKSIEFTPSVATVNLVDLQGDLAREIWRGNIPDGEYSKVFIEVSEVTGVLKATGETVEVKLPSSKLQIAKSFMIGGGEVTSFVYDLTVIEAGNSGQYILKPQAGESGADQEFTEVGANEEPGNNNNNNKSNNGNGKSAKKED
jgi:hypothetical protein